MSVAGPVLACTNILVTKGASADGSVMITYSADAAFLPRLIHVPGGDHAPGTMADVRGWEDYSVRGQMFHQKRKPRMLTG